MAKRIRSPDLAFVLLVQARADIEHRAWKDLEKDRQQAMEDRKETKRKEEQASVFFDYCAASVSCLLLHDQCQAWAFFISAAFHRIQN